MLKQLLLGCAMPAMAVLQAADPMALEGKDLKTVPGPLAHTEYLRDLVSPMGNTAMDLQIRRSARSVPAVPCVAVPPGNVVITHQVGYPSGWQAYQVDVAPGEKIRARLRGDHEAWFLVRCVTRMGLLAPGMLRNLIPTGNPEAVYHNAGTKPVAAYFVVDTSEPLIGTEPFTLTFTRD